MKELQKTIQFWQEVFTNILHEPVAIVLLFVAAIYWIYTSVETYKKKGMSRTIYLSAINFIVIVATPAIFILFTEALALNAAQNKFTSYATVDMLRWYALFATLCPLAIIVDFKYTKFKSGITMFGHLLVLFLGWLFNEWLGMLFISLPLLSIFYVYLFHYAQVIFPASNPEDNTERNNKFKAVIWYIWGAQYPFWVAESNATRKIEKRVDGDFFKDFGKPGITWMHSHQVFGQSAGIEFEEVDGPGITFVDQYVRPIAVVDLRTQLRPTQFDAVTKDGIEISVLVFIAFKIDQENWERWDNWDKETRHQIWRTSPILYDGLDLDKNLDSSYPYSSARVHAVLSTIGVGAPEENDDTPDIYWDEIVVQRVVKEARHVLAERTFDELWTPQKDERGSSALDEITKTIMARSKPLLQEIGIMLISSKLVNYSIEKDSKLRKQLVSTWLSAWTQKINSLKTDGATEAEKLRAQARSAAKAVFLSSISESLAKARKVDGDLPKQVVALNFLATLESLLENTSQDTIEKQSETLEMLRLFIDNK